MRFLVLLNESAGTLANAKVDDAPRRIADGFRAAGVDADVRSLDPATLAEVAGSAARPDSGFDAVVGGGGDGTLNTIANALAGTAKPFGVLPLGTHNHFAKDLGVPLDLDAAVERIAAGQPLRVDVGEVNGRVFINNSSLGLYPDIVRDRERQQKRLGRGKWPAFAWAALAVLRRYAFMRVRLTVDGTERVRRTPFVFIGNNEYRMEGFAIGERAGLQDGRLSLYVAQRPGRLRLLQLALRALFGRLRQARDFDTLLATEIVIESRHRRLHVATDGEVSLMTPPLRYRIRPASLTVMAGEPTPADNA
jgi:diacylglycerol kinase family enzyme